MTVHVDQRFLDAAVDSILCQEFHDLELVVVDDGTGLDAAFQALARRDPRIRIVTSPVNIGPAGAANLGIKAARSDIILRLDSDDIAEPTHVGRLVAALDEDPELGLVGNAVTLIDEAGHVIGAQRMPETDLEIRWTILFHAPFYQSAIAYRRSCFEAAGGYKVDQWISHDHYLWFGMLPFCRARNLVEPLTRYRANALGLSARHRRNARNRTHPIREALWARIGLTYDLYDDVFAYELTGFIRGDTIPVERRAAAYGKLLGVLRVFLAASRPFTRVDDAEAARQLAHGLVARVLASPPLRIKEMLRVCYLCWPLDRRAATGAAVSRLALGLRSRLQVTRRWLTRPRAIEAKRGVHGQPGTHPPTAARVDISGLFPIWASLLAARRNDTLDVLEIGSLEGRPPIFFLNHLNKCQLTCVDTFDGSPEHRRQKSSSQPRHPEDRLYVNPGEFGERVETIKAGAPQALASLAAAQRRFDLVHIDSGNRRTDVETDAGLSWPIVRDSGIVIFEHHEGDLRSGGPDRAGGGIDAFLSAIAGQYRELHRGHDLIIQKIATSGAKRSSLPTQGAPALRRAGARAPDKPGHEVEFVLIAEAGFLEAQALLLCKSIRCFAGAYSRSPITVVSPRRSGRPSSSTLRQFKQLGVEYLPIEVDSRGSQYGPSYKVRALAHVERRPGPPVIVQVDSDTLFIAEPDFSLGSCSAAARPVDVKGMCTTGAGDPFDMYWRDLCALVGVDYENIPVVQTTDGRDVVRASYNGGLIVSKRESGLFRQTENIFNRLIAAGMAPWSADRPAFMTGSGTHQGEATTFWGTSQAAFSLAAVAGSHRVRLLPETHNFPLHEIHPLTRPDPSRLVHIHYHGLFNTGSAEPNPILDGTLQLPAGIREWLQARLPLVEHPPSTARKPAGKRPKRKAILVLGMHRSGTSALGGTLNALGATGPKNLLDADLANPRGYWESGLLKLAHTDLLAAAGSTWHDWRQLDPQWLKSPAAEGHHHKIKAILTSEFADQPLFFVKDPRICRFVPLVSSILAEMEVEAVAFLPVRNPLEVALSLERRDGLSLPKSLLLWLRHVLEAEHHSRHMPRYFLRHEEVVTDWQQHLSRAAKATGVVWPTGLGKAQAEIEQFLTPDLHHQRATIEDLQNHPDVTPLVRTTYDILCAMAAGGDSPDLRHRLDLVRAKFDESCDVLGSAAVAEAERLRGELEARIAEHDARQGLKLEHASLLRDQSTLLAERNALLASHSWRLTAPLRWLRRRFGR